MGERTSYERYQAAGTREKRMVHVVVLTLGVLILIGALITVTAIGAGALGVAFSAGVTYGWIITYRKVHGAHRE